MNDEIILCAYNYQDHFCDCGRGTVLFFPEGVTSVCELETAVRRYHVGHFQ